MYLTNFDFHVNYQKIPQRFSFFLSVDAAFLNPNNKKWLCNRILPKVLSCIFFREILVSFHLLNRNEIN